MDELLEVCSRGPAGRHRDRTRIEVEAGPADVAAEDRLSPLHGRERYLDVDIQACRAQQGRAELARLVGGGPGPAGPSLRARG